MADRLLLRPPEPGRTTWIALEPHEAPRAAAPRCRAQAKQRASKLGERIETPASNGGRLQTAMDRGLETSSCTTIDQYGCTRTLALRPDKQDPFQFWAAPRGLPPTLGGVVFEARSSSASGAPGRGQRYEPMIGETRNTRTPNVADTALMRSSRYMSRDWTSHKYLFWSHREAPRIR